MNTKYKNKEWLQDNYIKKRLSTTKLGKNCNVNDGLIWYWLKKNNILIRSRNEATQLRCLRQVNHCNLSQKAIEWINGELLGDGSIVSYSNYSASFVYGSKFYEYINYVFDMLESFGIFCSGKIYKIYKKKFDRYYYYYSSLHYSKLLLLRKKWYPDGKKIVPKDIRLTSLTLRQWFIGDGTLMCPRQTGWKSSIVLYTCGFSIPDVEFLKAELIKLGFKTTRHKHNNALYISTKSTKEFLNYIGPCPVDRYQYKWDYNKRKEVN